MADYTPADDDSGDSALERAGYYWKKSATAYSRACNAESAEVKKLYMQLAMTWAALAKELERPQLKPVQDGLGHETRNRH